MAVLDPLPTAVVIAGAVVSLPAIPVAFVETSVPNEDSSVPIDSDVKLEAVVPMEVDSLEGSTVVSVPGAADVDPLPKTVVASIRETGAGVVDSLIKAVVVSSLETGANVVTSPVPMVSVPFGGVVILLPASVDVDVISVLPVHAATTPR